MSKVDQYLARPRLQQKGIGYTPQCLLRGRHFLSFKGIATQCLQTLCSSAQLLQRFISIQRTSFVNMGSEFSTDRP
jgi:hypothetical protein